MKLIKTGVHIDRIGREHFHLDPLRPILQSPFPVGQRPKADEQKPVLERQLDQLGVDEEGGLDDAGSGHYATSTRSARRSRKSDHVRADFAWTVIASMDAPIDTPRRNVSITSYGT